MDIHIKEQAAKRLATKLEGGKLLKLYYDTEGCGCGVNGIPVLWIVDEPSAGDVEIQTNAMPVLVEKAQMLFYADRLTIDVSGSNQYRLSSPEEILNGRMNVIKKQ
ncbi:iron-sulfur cluster biosynthesis family protein [Bacillus aerolatus]|uniref:iron-sulfur cluster biosynthesis family protein n=1 Tax=Bacillus aerolatus TaxID=2653354 RepID=UPI00177E4276|nr:iron-sulfur cluster biosynthesis family protein [Bacillus aerolatus]